MAHLVLCVDRRCERQCIGEGERQSALDWAVSRGWLQKAGDEVRLTEAGFDMNFTQ